MAFGLSLGKLFGGDAKPFGSAGAIGVDFGTSSIKVVQLRDLRGIPTLLTYGELQLGPFEGIDIGRVTHLPPDKQAEALTSILKEAGTSGTEVAFSISSNASFLSTLMIPTADADKVGAMVPVEARKYVPLSLSKVTLDWVPLGTAEKEHVTHVLLSAIFNEAMEWYAKTFQTAQLTPVAQEIEVFSAVRSVLSPKDEVVALIDLGASSARLCIVVKGVMHKTHTIPLSGADITAALADELSIEFEAAEAAKRTYGLQGNPQDPRIQKIILGHIERGMREFHTVIKRYEDVEKAKVEKVIVTGGGALLRGLPAYTHDMFSMPVSVADPFSKVSYPSFLAATLAESGASFAVALGAALRAYRKE
jgi:type IV pilus assembly protein PilM